MADRQIVKLSCVAPLVFPTNSAFVARAVSSPDHSALGAQSSDWNFRAEDFRAVLRRDVKT
jgi:hypothetical protein